MTQTPNFHILVVDDNKDDVSIITRLLSQFGRASFRVSSTSDTRECERILQQESIDLLILDHSMPGEDGLEFLRRVAPLMQLPPVILMTGQGDYGLAAEAIRRGAVDCISKHAMTSDSLGRAVEQAVAISLHEAEVARFDENVLNEFVKTASKIDHAETSLDLADLAESLGRQLGLSVGQITLLRFGALLHDVGIMGMNRAIIDKPGPLTAEELNEIRYHPLVGERITAPLNLAAEVRKIIRHHHERWDGNGYVDGLAGEDIPVLARVVSVIDAYAAMIAERPYRRALSSEEALERLRSGAGSQWDPAIVAAFIKMMQSDPLSEAA